MDKSKIVYVAGHRGLVGSAILRELQRQGFQKVIFRTHQELDLEDRAATFKFFEKEKPEIVFLAAAKVGGILANNTYPVDFLINNLMIQTNVLQAAHASKCERVIFLGSSCVYPRECPQPIREEYLMTGPLEKTNQAYALAKITGIELCWSYNRQYGTKWLAAMPTNMYGPGDNYNLKNSHVMPALIRKMHEAKISGASEVTVWGSGNPRREFLFSEDLGKALVFLAFLESNVYDTLVNPSQCPLINIGVGEDVTIRELAQHIADVVGFKGTFRYDTSMPDGTMRKVMDVSKIHGLGWKAQTSLRSGLEKAYRSFLDTL